MKMQSTIGIFAFGMSVFLGGSAFAASADQAAIDTLQKQIQANQAACQKAISDQQAQTQKAISGLQSNVQNQINHLQSEMQQMQTQLNNEIKQVQAEMVSVKSSAPASAAASVKK